jgi:hypothetical protein
MGNEMADDGPTVNNSRNFRAIAEQARRDGLWALPGCQDPAQKHPCIPWKPYQERQPTDAEITSWIARYPTRNGLYLTGECLGRIVIDCDHDDADHEMRRQGIPPTQTALTRRGRHYHFKHPGFRVGNSASVFYPGVDIRGDGGIAVAVGSVHKTGFIYRWAEGRSPQEIGLPAAPDWLIEWLQSRVVIAWLDVEPKEFNGITSAWARTIVHAEIDQLQFTPKGARNDMLARVSFKLGQLAGGGEADHDELLYYLQAVAQEWPNTKKSFDTIARCFAAGQQSPRVAPVESISTPKWQGRERRGKQRSINPWY